MSVTHARGGGGSAPSKVWVSDRSGIEEEAIRTGLSWTCPRDGGDLGDHTGYRAVRIGNQCPICRRVVVRLDP